MMAEQSISCWLFEHYYSALMRTLPMNNLFISKLCKHDLLPQNIKCTIKCMHRRLDRATYFLDNAIKPELDDQKILKLLAAMKESGYDNVKEFAYELQLHLFLNDTGSLQTTTIQSKKICIIIAAY